MGFTYVRVKIANLSEPQRQEEVDLLVDTGAMYTIVPRAILERLGTRTALRRRFTLANGEAIERDVGYVSITLEGEVGVSPVIFGGETDVSVLGVTTLEFMGFEVDPVTKRLKPATLYLV